MTLSTGKRMWGSIGVGVVSLTGIATIWPLIVPVNPSVQTGLQTLAQLAPHAIGAAVTAATTVLLVILVSISQPTAATDELFRRLQTEPPEAVTVTDVEQAGTAVDADIRIGASTARDRLQRIAVEQEAFATGETAAQEAVATGDWTDIRPAALFVGTAVDPTIWERLRAWIDPESEYQRRMLATIEALEISAEEERR